MIYKNNIKSKLFTIVMIIATPIGFYLFGLIFEYDWLLISVFLGIMLMMIHGFLELMYYRVEIRDDCVAEYRLLQRKEVKLDYIGNAYITYLKNRPVLIVEVINTNINCLELRLESIDGSEQLVEDIKLISDNNRIYDEDITSRNGFQSINRPYFLDTSVVLMYTPSLVYALYNFVKIFIEFFAQFK